ncbi:MAG: tetratricopeptide repeat protein [Cyanobacteria bacterium P01_H01_bin.58]
MDGSLLTKCIGWIGLGIVGTILTATARANDPPPITPPSASPYEAIPPPGSIQLPEPRPLAEPLQSPAAFQFPLAKQLFSPLLDPTFRIASAASRPDTDEALQSTWQQLADLEETSPPFLTQLEASLASLLSIQQQYQRVGDRWGELKTLEMRLKLHYLACQDDQALQLAQTGFQLAQATSSVSAERDWAEILAALYWVLGNAEEAIALHKHSLAIRRSPEGTFSMLEAYDWIEIGHLYASLGREADAIAAYEQAVASALNPPTERILDVYYAGGHSFKQSAIEALIAAHQVAGDMEQQAYWMQQLEQAHQDNEQFNRAFGHLSERWAVLSNRSAENPPLSQQQVMLEEALQIFRQIGDRWGEMDALKELSRITLDQANYEAAIAYGEAAFELATTFNAPRTQEALLPILTEAYRETGQADQAEAIQRQYEQNMTQLDSMRDINPVFRYGFAVGYSYAILPVAHQQRVCASNE